MSEDENPFEIRSTARLIVLGIGKILQEHEPVLLKDFIKLAAPITGSMAHLELGVLLELQNGACKVLAIDKDSSTKVFLKNIQNEYGDMVTFYNQNFADMQENNITCRDDICGVVLRCFFNAFRQSSEGFSFKESGPLDMRMGNQSGPTASEIINLCSEVTLADLIFFYGQERKAKNCK